MQPIAEEQRQNRLLMQYLHRYFSPQQTRRLVQEFSFSELRRLLGEMDIEFFALCYFPKYFDRTFGNFHKELFAELKYMLDNTGLIEAFGLPREHGKSTINSFLFPLYSTMYGKSQFTLIISATEQIALPFLDMIKDELENNPLLLEDFGCRKGNRWNNNEIWIRGRDIDACIMIRGIDGSLRGIHFKQYRPQLVLLDDLLKDDTAKSETKREQVKSTFTDVVIPIGTKDTNILVVGTVLHEEDLMAELLKGKIPGVRSIRKSAVLSFSDRDDLWGEWERRYNNLPDPDRINTAKAYFDDNREEMLEGTEILWHEYLDYYYLMCKKQAMGDKSFYKELQNDPRSTDDYIFQTIGLWESLPDYSDLEVVMYIDPAIKAGKRNDYSAITILARHEKTGQMFVLDGSIHKLLPDALFQVALEKLALFPVEKIGFEATQAQSYMKQKFEETLWEQKIFLPVEEVTAKGQKHERIITLEPEIKRGFILFNPANMAYNNQVRDYNKSAKHDDAPDSLYGAVQLVQGVQKIKFFERGLLF
ncbi:phage terminase large subunit [Pygmaiobacter massiliensis]|uniref:phage terminase large subunit n=1 Tax=Pygmaiobacter massiliensis TaxID=1917873 RepID=UPI002A8158AB|nr:phage terminase large subunit [Pygmaiobacter massiliensis]MDY4785113.1 phage terminase large subunit [Pygmaiobacter massiliensis]